MTKHDQALVGAAARPGDILAHRTLRASVGLPRLTSLSLIAIGLAVSWALVYVAGGAGAMVPHLYYLPILFAATRFGPFAALAVSLLAGGLAGPLSPEVVATDTPQDPAQWLTRTAFFVVIGQLSAWLLAPSIRPLADELRSLKVEHRIRGALANDEFHLVYQPIYATRSGSFAGVEALIRWEHPVTGNIPPDEFMGVAEESELIHEISDFVLEQACRRAAEWRIHAEGQGRAPFHVAINLSARDLERADLSRTIESALARHGLPGELLQIELTERVLAFDGAGFQLRQLKKLGVKLAADDFGTGYSSLSYLDRFPFDIIKIDRSLIAGLSPEPSSQCLARGMIALANSLGLTTVAEGIETPGQLGIAREIGFDFVQGFLFARPQPGKDVAANLLGARPEPFSLAENVDKGGPDRRP